MERCSAPSHHDRAGNDRLDPTTRERYSQATPVRCMGRVYRIDPTPTGVCFRDITDPFRHQAIGTASRSADNSGWDVHNSRGRLLARATETLTAIAILRSAYWP
ncbi:hypothetical protein ABT160_33170 [Streptomyces sp. NPDC001941]|uniref:hypothetical protein n=1 Tax=Streptomyces sp. NPDC001941 TaxID=3154659 RepID=UPI00331E8048